MSLVENLVNQISSKAVGNVTNPIGIDLDDDTFEKLLQKGLGDIKNNNIQNEKLNMLGMIGQPSGMIIEPFDGTEAINPLPAKDIITESDMINIKDVNIGSNYFSNLLKNSPKEHLSVMNIAQKHAANAYNVFGRGFVGDIADFANDITTMLK